MTSSPFERAKQSILEEFEKLRSQIEPTEKEKEFYFPQATQR